ncbi:MAG: DUF1624 domain-containing protein, partial [Pyrinomonadaceae bacterium]
VSRTSMPETQRPTKSRIRSVDILRGLVTAIMVLDHVREFVNADAFVFSPTDLSKTTTALFFTRWVTHFCAPVFVFLAGTSIYLQLMNGKTPRELSRFLFTRGLWLIVLEFTVIRFAVFFNFDYSFLGFAEVIWIFGVSMIMLAGMIFLPLRVIAVIGLVMVAGHNLLDGLTIPPAISFAGTPPPDFLQSMWLFLHQQGMVHLGDATKVFVAYPLIPWIGVMALGYVVGSLYAMESEKRRRILLRLGIVTTLCFVILRAVNIYGDPSPWSAQPSALFTFLSFLNTTKYPVSLQFLLMTLGPAMLVLYATDRSQSDNRLAKFLITYGRVPLFFFILQMFYAHAAGVVLGYAAGQDAGFLFTNFPFAAGIQVPAGFGFPLWTAYAVWIVGLVLLYPLCAWYGKVKRNSRHWAFSYL